MRTIKPVGRYARDYKRLKAGAQGKTLTLLNETIAMLASDQSLPERLRDHALSGEWRDCRDCHVRPDLVLICRKIGDDSLELIRLGSHSELF